jgi:hypothetical protein
MVRHDEESKSRCSTKNITYETYLHIFWFYALSNLVLVLEAAQWVTG